MTRQLLSYQSRMAAAVPVAIAAMKVEAVRSVPAMVTSPGPEATAYSRTSREP